MLKDECVVHIGQNWAEHLPVFSWMKIFPPYIPHENTDYIKEKIEKKSSWACSQNKLDEMKDIVQDIHKYVPKKATNGSSLSKITSGKDYLTFEHHKSE